MFAYPFGIVLALRSLFGVFIEDATLPWPGGPFPSPAFAKPQRDSPILGEQIGASTLKFLLLLVDRNRIALLDGIAQKFLELSYKQESIEIAKVTSSVQLSAQQQQNIAEKLKVITGAKQIKLALKVDPQLIGGFTIEVGSKLIDTSIRGQLRQISSLLGA